MLLVPKGSPWPILVSSWIYYEYAVSGASGWWVDGGGDTFDGGSSGYGLKITASGSVGFVPIPTSNGAAKWANTNVSIGSNVFSIRQGFINTGMYLFDIRPPAGVTFDVSITVDYGFDASIQSGTVFKPFSIDGASYELKTFWASRVALDSWSTNSQTQATLTIVPYQDSWNTSGGNSSTVVNGAYAGDRIYSCPGLGTGVSVYVHWGQNTIASVQANIISDLSRQADLSVDPRDAGWVYPWPKFRLPALPPLRVGRSGIIVRRRMSPEIKRVFLYPSNGKIAGHTKINGVLSPCDTRVHEKRTGKVVGRKMSSATGYYEFTGLNPLEEYYVTAHDVARGYNASIQDMITPEVT